MLEARRLLLSTLLVGLSLAPLGCDKHEPASSPPVEIEPAGEGASPAPGDELGALIDAEAAAAIVAAPDRDEADLEGDRRRAPTELLAFMQLRAGMRVADIGAGTGYTTELLARAVGPEGRVYGQNPTFVLERFAAEGWTARLAKPVNANVVSLEREFDDPFPGDIEPLQRVINILFYHDFEWQGVDRQAHLADAFAALAPGGIYVIVDASAAEGHGASDSKTLHRVEQALVVREFEAAGFQLVREAEFLRNPEDTRDWNATPWSDPERAARGEFSDKFVLAFQKP